MVVWTFASATYLLFQLVSCCSCLDVCVCQLSKTLTVIGVFGDVCIWLRQWLRKTCFCTQTKNLSNSWKVPVTRSNWKPMWSLWRKQWWISKNCAEASNKAFMQPVGKKHIAAGMLYEHFNRLEVIKRNLHNTENEMMKPKVTNDHFTWHESCHQALKAILKQWITHNMEWVSRWLARNLKERGHCLTLCRLQDKLSLGFEKKRQMNEKIEEMIRRKEPPAKLATLVERYNNS